MSTTREEWLALAERIEKATGPDRGIDAAISIALGDVPKGFTADKMRGLEACFLNKSGYTWGAPRYTSSIDTITARIEREFPGHSWAVLRREIGTKAMLDQTPAKDKIAASLTLRPVRTAIYADAKTPALALCAVFCRAMAERD